MSRRTSTAKACENLRNVADFTIEFLSKNVSDREIQAHAGLHVLFKRLCDCSTYCDNLIKTLVNDGKCHSEEMTLFLEQADALIARIAVKVEEGRKQQRRRREVVNLEEDEVDVDEDVAIFGDDDVSKGMLNELRIVVRRIKSPSGPLIQKQWDDIENQLNLVVTTVQADKKRIDRLEAMCLEMVEELREWRDIREAKETE